MNKLKVIFWLARLPLLELYIRLPFLEIQTVLMSYCLEMAVVDYVRFRIKIWKYEVRWGLFDTKKKFYEKV